MELGRSVAAGRCLNASTVTVKSVVLRVSEARDLGDVNRYQFYEHMKPYTAAPPDVLRVDEKFLREHSVVNCTGVIITTNHKTDGMYLPAEDRRHFVAWSDAEQADFSENYWRELWGWYQNGGFEDAAAYLSELDLSAFDPKERDQRRRRFGQSLMPIALPRTPSLPM